MKLVMNTSGKVSLFLPKVDINILHIMFSKL